MASCKECLHYEACKSFADHDGFDLALWTDKHGLWCSGENFKDKSLFVELPCKIGAKVYVIDWCGKRYRGYNCPYGCSGGQREKVFRQDCVKYCGIDSRGFSLDDVDRIGKDIFLTKYEAKNAIIERAEKNEIDT